MDDQHEHAIHTCSHCRRWVSDATDVRSSRLATPATSGALKWTKRQKTKGGKVVMMKPSVPLLEGGVLEVKTLLVIFYSDITYM